jgi:integrase
MFMGKITVSVPLITWRDGRPRFSPGPRLRKPPFSMKGEDLRHGPNGAWFTLEEAMAWSAARQALIAQAEAAAPKEARRIVARGTSHVTLAELFDRWFKEPRMKGVAVVEGRKQRRPLSANTVANYRQGAKRLEQLDKGTIWFSPAAAITPTVLAGVFHRIEVLHGLSSARGARATLSAMFGWSIGAGLHKGANPVAAMSQTMPVPPPRIRFGSIDELKHLVAAADAIGRPEIGDAIMLGLWTGQRQNDRLLLVEDQQGADGIGFRQHKKGGQPLLIPAAPELSVRLRAIRHRRRDWKVNFPLVVVDERQRQPFTASWYRHTFARVRDFAATGKGIHELTSTPVTITPMPSLADFHDQDLRDTAVTWLALAGCTIPQIGSITGHSPKTIEQVLKHYLGMHPELARSAIARLVAWYDEKGEAK